MGGFYLPMQACVLSFRNRRFLSPPSYSLPICRFPCLFYPSRIPFPVIQSLVDPTYAAGSFRVQRYGGRTLFKYRCRYLKRNLTTAFRNRRWRYFIKFHYRFLARRSCIHRWVPHMETPLRAKSKGFEIRGKTKVAHQTRNSRNG